MNDAIVADVAQKILDVVSARLEEGSESSPKVPTRAYIWVGEPAWDCDQLVVTWAQNGPGVPGQDLSEIPFRCEPPTTARYEVLLLRCSPVGDETAPAGAADASASSRLVMIDGILIVRALIEDLRTALADVEELHQPQIAIGVETTPGPEGGLFGISQSVDVSLV